MNDSEKLTETDTRTRISRAFYLGFRDLLLAIALVLFVVAVAQTWGVR